MEMISYKLGSQLKHLNQGGGGAKQGVDKNRRQINKLPLGWWRACVVALGPVVTGCWPSNSVTRCLGTGLILEKLLAATLADKMPHMGSLIGQGLAKCPVGDSTGAKGLPEGLARLLGHDVLAVVAGDQHHQMVGFDPAPVAEMDLTLFARLALGCHGGIRSHVDGEPIIIFSTWLSTPRSGAVSRPNRLGRRRVQRFGPPGSIGGVKAGMLCRGAGISVLLIPKHQ